MTGANTPVDGLGRRPACVAGHAFSRINLIAPDVTARVDGRKDGTGSQGFAGQTHHRARRRRGPRRDHRGGGEGFSPGPRPPV